MSDLDELGAFAAVFEASGFTHAAKHLRLTTNAVSLRVQKLETRLGGRLLVRTHAQRLRDGRWSCVLRSRVADPQRAV